MAQPREFNAETDPGHLLATFIATLVDDLDVVVQLRYELLVPAELDEPSRIRMQNALEMLPRAWEETLPSVGPLWVALESLPGSTLGAAGLVGPQLRLKIDAWYQSRLGLVGEFEGPDADLDDSVPPHAGLPRGASSFDPRLPRRIPRSLKRALRRLAKTLSYADTLLGSLTTVIPIAEPLKEFKETVEKLAGDTSDALPDAAKD